MKIAPGKLKPFLEFCSPGTCWTYSFMLHLGHVSVTFLPHPARPDSSFWASPYSANTPSGYDLRSLLTSGMSCALRQGGRKLHKFTQRVQVAQSYDSQAHAFSELRFAQRDE